jgi:inhibitor of growth protein 3
MKLVRAAEGLDEPPLNKKRGNRINSKAGRSEKMVADGQGDPRFSAATGRGDGDPDDGADDEKYCVCRRPSFGAMIACEFEDCLRPGEWYHLPCVGLRTEPETW